MIFSLVEKNPGLTAKELLRIASQSQNFSEKEFDVVLNNLKNSGKITAVSYEGKSLYYKNGPSSSDNQIQEIRKNQEKGRINPGLVILIVLIVIFALLFFTETGGMILYGAIILIIGFLIFRWIFTN